MGRCILIIEDEVEVRELIVSQLRIDGINEEILQAQDPIRGLDLFTQNKHRIACIIIDQYMPIENGLQLCEIIKKERPDLKIIMFTGDTDIQNHNDLSKIDTILFKPEGLRELAHYVKLASRKQ